jgi:FAD/FMN-containing dehydrogenase
VLVPGEPGFHEAIRIWNGLIHKKPAAVVQPASTVDVSRTVSWAARTGVELSVKGGGCNIAGTALSDGGLTLDMSRLRAVEVDARRRLVQAQPGCVNGDVDRATAPFGRATVLGFDVDTGIAGLTLGGGFGYLTPKHGLTLDNLEEVEVVLADGRVLRAANDEHSDLFWAVRGGGGNFGVVTRFTYRLHPVPPLVHGGMIIWPADDAATVLDACAATLGTASRNLSLTGIMRLAPPAPFIPPAWHGKPVIATLVCHLGDDREVRRDLAPLRDAAACLGDTVSERTYMEQQSLLSRVQPPRGMHSYWKSEFLDDLPQGARDALVAGAATITSPLSQLQLFAVGGALNERAAGDTAFAAREARFSVVAAACWPAESPDADSHIRWTRETWAAIRPFSSGLNYINLQTADEGDDRIRAAYGDNYSRLRAIKATYDSQNVFKMNRNIPPRYDSSGEDESYLRTGAVEETELDPATPDPQTSSGS